MSDLPSLSGGSGVGSLAQSARQKHLKGARVILILVGILTLAVNSFLFWNSSNEIRQLVAQQALDPEGIPSILGVVRLIYGAGIAFGVVFCVLGLLVTTFPVLTTVLGLVLYIGAAAGYAWLDPASLARGWLFKILIVAGLVKAVQAAIAYKKETEQLAGTEPAAVGFGAEL
jgi:hypothetical protein